MSDAEADGVTTAIELFHWALTGSIPNTECPIARETMWSDRYEWERDRVSEWIDIGGEA